MSEEARLRARIADLEDRLLATGQWHARPPSASRRNTMKRSPITFSVDHLKEIFRDYCIQSSGEIPNEVDNIYVIIGSNTDIGGNDEGIPTNFSSLTVEFADDEVEDEQE